MIASQRLQIEIPYKAAKVLFTPSRLKILYGGRGSAKSWSVARALIAKSHCNKLRILCAREFQSSIRDSVHKLLADQIYEMGLKNYFKILKTSIYSKVTESEFIFKGLRHEPGEIKSTEGIDICWVEEAQSTSKYSWEILVPTIRKPKSEIWVTFNPSESIDPTYQFVLNPPPGAIIEKIGWQDNPWFPEELDRERKYLLSIDPQAYTNIWEGEPRVIGDAIIFKDKYTVKEFHPPEDAHFFHGVDWGFAQDPTVLIRCYRLDDCLYIDQEAFGYGVDLDDIATLFKTVDTSREWPIKADSSRPETINHMRNKGFNIQPAKKWDGSVKDGIFYLRGLQHIYIHPRCKNMIQEASMYSYKTDARAGTVLPIIVDKHNHGWDAVRYSLDGYITQGGMMGVYEALGKEDW